MSPAADIHRPPEPASLLVEKRANPKPLRIAVPGVAVDSPFGRRLAAALSGMAEIIPGGIAPSGWLWRLYLRGTTLDPCGHGMAESDEAAKPDLVLDLHGSKTTATVRTWRIVDGFGNPLLRPFGCPADTDAVTSLYLTESGPDLSGSVVLAEAHISARRRYRDVLDTAGQTAVWLVAKAARAPPLQPAVFECGARTARPVGFVAGRVAHIKAWMRDHIGTEIWAIGLIAGAPQEFLNSRAVAPNHWLEIPRKIGFVADPFPWPAHQRAFLCEYYAHRTGCGTLAAYFPDEGSGDAIRRLDIPVTGHLSYPFTYVEDDTTYCLPEMAAERYQALYVLLPDGSLRQHCIVADHIMMADPTLFRHDGRYWIAYSDATRGVFEDLCLLYAERLEGPWIRHPLNPVKIDARSSRPGGTPFQVGKILFRPAQDCSFSYGRAVVINRIVVCTPERYEESPVSRLTPEPKGPYPHGFHTFSVTPDGVLLDGKRVVFSAGIILERLQRRLRRAIRGRIR